MVLVIGGHVDFPMLIPAIAKGVAKDGSVTLAEPIDLGQGPTISVARDIVIDYGSELHLRVNQMTATALDALQAVRTMLTAHGEQTFPTIETLQLEKYNQIKGARPIGFANN
jgi:hypothetical protein